VVILLSGLTIVITSGQTIGTQVVGALTLVLASLIPFAIPIGIYLIMGKRGEELLRRIFKWMMTHDRALTAGTLLFFGAIFFGRGLGGLL
jgi:Sap, sulfolipid-1-addressing protein